MIDKEFTEFVIKSSDNFYNHCMSHCNNCANQNQFDFCSDCLVFEDTKATMTKFVRSPKLTLDIILSDISDEQIMRFMEHRRKLIMAVVP